MRCPDPFALAEAAADPSCARGEQILGHAAFCTACRSVLADLQAAGEIPLPETAHARLLTTLASSERPGPRFRWIPLGAAAALLLAVLLHADPHRRDGDGKAGASGAGGIARCADPFPGARTDGILRVGDRDTGFILGRSAALCLKSGTRARFDGAPGTALTLLDGALWLEDAGEALKLQVAGVTVRVESASLLVETAPVAGPLASLWCPLAQASEPVPARLAVLSGAVHVGETEVLAGQEIRIDASGPGAPRPLVALPVWRPDLGWRSLDGVPRPLGVGSHSLVAAPPGDSYVWEALIRRRHPGTSAGIRFAAAGRGFLLPLGVPLAQGGISDPLRIRVEVRDGWVSLHAGAFELLREPLETLLREESHPQADAACGLHVWGGELELLDSRWKASR